MDEALTIGAASAPTLARLTGRSSLKIDPKGRVVLPVIHRPRFASGLFCSAWPGNHLALYDPQRWDEFVLTLKDRRRAGLISLSEFNGLTADSPELLPDTAGRIVIPGWMRSEFDLLDDVVITGNYDHLGLYAADRCQEMDRESRVEIAVRLASMGVG